MRLTKKRGTSGSTERRKGKCMYIYIYIYMRNDMFTKFLQQILSGRLLFIVIIEAKNQS